jgi:hypothetical protein
LIALGDPVVAASIQEILKSLVVPGILRGFDMTAPTSTSIAIQPGAAMSDSGVVLVDNEIRTLPFTPTVAPSNFTIYYQYQTSTVFGGAPASLQMQAGLLPAQGFAGGVLIGWVRYPGGSVTLNAQSHFTSAPRVRVEPPQPTRQGEFQTLFSPFSSKWVFQSIVGPTPVVQDAWNGAIPAVLTSLSNTGLSLSNSVLVIPIEVPTYGFHRLAFEASVDSGANLTVTILDKNGTTILPVESNFFTNVAMARRELTIPYNVNLAPHQQAFIRLACDIQPLNFIRFKSIGISSDANP